MRTFEQALAERGPARDDLARRLEAELIATAIRRPTVNAEARRRLDTLDVDAADGPGARMLLGLRAYHDATLGTNRDRALADVERVLSGIPPEDERGFSSAYGAAVYVLLFADRLDQGMRLVEAGLASARSRGGALSFSNATGMRAIFGYARGTLVEAEADARLALEALPHRDALFTPHLYAYLAQVLVERGAVDEAAETLARIEGALGVLPERFSHMPLFRACGMVASARGDHRGALTDAMTTGRVLRAIGVVNPAVSYPGWRSQAALAQHGLGERAEALELAREEMELARAWGAPRALGRALRIHGLIEGGSGGIDHILEAVDVLADSPARLEYAHALTDLGGALRRGNHRAAARDPLRQALELAQRSGAILVAERAHEELIASGARPRRLVVSGIDALTPSERRIAAMAVEGLSNREIAQSLFVTLRTVEMHLSNAFHKLGVASRTQLPAALVGDKRIAAGRR